MKVLRSLLTLSLLVVLCSSFTLQKGKRKAVSEDAAIKSSKEKTISKPVYAFGFSASFSVAGIEIALLFCKTVASAVEPAFSFLVCCSSSFVPFL